MYRVVLCEDEEIFLQAQEKTCRNILEKLNIDYQIAIFSSSTDFLHAFFDQGMRYDLLLLDIIMDDVNGITLAKEIRKKDTSAAIIFITSSSEYALQGYDVKALHYLMKPLNEDILTQIIEEDYNNRFKMDYLVLESDLGKMRVALKEIVCAETIGRRVKITLMQNQTAYFYGTLTDFLTELPHDIFIRCHQSYAVNISNIRELTRQDAITFNEQQIPVSRTFFKQVKQAFLQKMREQ
ncbi:LytR/AlgR family response regulator transcription factor [Scatolibacter rhodanostii]|uniref:LytR/AlgR family response regulator transcription factor n=1 Tax=Scatolibacter rhodanostii TaxID=2014781 RepID=UPI000C06E0C5|nr:LytTR family DNA-binding domain-containing protein [Scatolibacter rhodanostii]